MELGAGRKTKEDKIDYTAGIVLNKKAGERIIAGDVLATLFTNSKDSLNNAEKLFLSALSFTDTLPKKSELIYKTIIDQ